MNPSTKAPASGMAGFNLRMDKINPKRLSANALSVIGNSNADAPVGFRLFWSCRLGVQALR